MTCFSAKGYVNINASHVFFLVFFFVQISTYSQISFKVVDEIHDFEFDQNLNAEDSLIFFYQAQKEILKVVESGFPFASVNSVCKNEDGSLFFEIGKGPLVNNVLYELELGQKVFTTQDFKKVQLKYKKEFLDQGYPFAEMRLDSFYINQTHTCVRYKIEAGKQVQFDSLIVLFANNDEFCNPVFIKNFLGFKKGEHFSDKFLDQIEYVSSISSFFQLSEPIELRFVDHQAIVTVIIKRNKSNEIGGLIGFTNQDRFQLMGAMNSVLNNLLEQGEEISVKWYRPISSYQLFDSKFVLPFILGTRLSLDNQLFVENDDSLFSKVNLSLDLRFRSIDNSEFLIGYGSRRASSKNSDIAINQKNNLLNIGFSKLFLSSNNSVIIKGTLSLLNSNNNVLGNRVLYEPYLGIKWKHRFSIRYSIYHKISSAFLVSKSVLSPLDYKRYGGNEIRGFLQEQFYSPYALVSSTEWCYNFDRSSYLYLFVDNSLLEIKNKSLYLGGVGFGIITYFKSNLLDLSYGYGYGIREAPKFGVLNWGFTTKF